MKKYYICITIILIYSLFFINYHTYPFSTIINVHNDIDSKKRYYEYLECNIPFIENINLQLSNYINTTLLMDKYPDKIIHVLESFTNIDPLKLPVPTKMKLKDFIQNTIINNKNTFYLKSEDEYNFLAEIGIYNTILKCFNNYIFPSLYVPFIKEEMAYWYGPKDSITAFHYDTDHTNLLYVIEGKKKVYLIHPKYDQYMKGYTNIQRGASWSSTHINEIISNPNIKHECIILKKNQILNIPRYWWHAVINMEATMAVTYHYYTFSHLFFNNFA